MGMHNNVLEAAQKHCVGVVALVFRRSPLLSQLQLPLSFVFPQRFFSLWYSPPSMFVLRCFCPSRSLSALSTPAPSLLPFLRLLPLFFFFTSSLPLSFLLRLLLIVSLFCVVIIAAESFSFRARHFQLYCCSFLKSDSLRLCSFIQGMVKNCCLVAFPMLPALHAAVAADGVFGTQPSNVLQLSRQNVLSTRVFSEGVIEMAKKDNKKSCEYFLDKNKKDVNEGGHDIGATKSLSESSSEGCSDDKGNHKALLEAFSSHLGTYATELWFYNFSNLEATLKS